MGFEPVIAPLFEIVPVAWEVPDPADFDAVVMTSANAARHGGPGLAALAHLPVFAVGEATAEAAREAGFADVSSGSGNALDLSGHVGSGRVGSRRVLHLAGADHLALDLASVTTISVYSARPLATVLPKGDVVLVHSARAGTRFAELAAERAALSIVAISAAAASACGGGWAQVVAADRPREHAMLASLGELCERRGHG